KMDPTIHRYSHAPGVLSFVGFAPADDPRIAMIVMLDEPKNEKWGSEAAAPIFSAIGREALRHLNVPPRGTTPVPIVRAEAGVTEPPPTLRLASFDEATASGVMPSLQGRSLRQAMAVLAPPSAWVGGGAGGAGSCPGRRRGGGGCGRGCCAVSRVRAGGGGGRGANDRGDCAYGEAAGSVARQAGAGDDARGGPRGRL